MTALLSPSFWFSPTPPSLIPMIQLVFLVAFVSMTILGVVALVLRFRLGLEKLTRSALERAGACLLTCGLLGLLLVGMAYERIPYLSMRVLFLALGIFFVLWAYKLYTFAWIEIPQIKAKHQQQEQYNKWLPKRKKK